MRTSVLSLVSVSSAVAFTAPRLSPVPSSSLNPSPPRPLGHRTAAAAAPARGPRLPSTASGLDSAATTPAELNPAPAAGAVGSAGGDAPPKKARIGSTPVLMVEGDTVETLPSHVALVVGFALLSAVALGPTAAALASGGPSVWASLGAVGLFTLIFSDFFSGVFHWATDNYGNGKTPVFGGVIAAFQGHHGNPWTITHRGFCNNVHKIAKAALPLLALGMAVTADPGWRLALVIFLNAQMLSQEFHKLSHEVTPPRWAAWLQDRNLIISRKVHGMHHKPPFEAHYCILTGWCNPLLDRNGLNLWRRLEAAVYRRNGQAPNCWGEPGGERLQEEALAL